MTQNSGNTRQEAIYHECVSRIRNVCIALEARNDHDGKLDPADCSEHVQNKRRDRAVSLNRTQEAAWSTSVDRVENVVVVGSIGLRTGLANALAYPR